MNGDKFIQANSSIRKVTWLGIWVNVLLGIVKFFVGIAVNSIALATDGLHSFSDLASDGAVLLGSRLGSKKPDKKHPYGHGRMETFAAFFIALFLIIVGGYMIYYSGMDMAEGEVREPSLAAIFISIFSLAAKEFLFQITKKTAVKYDSSMLFANAWHHRSDALSSLAVVVGVGASFFGLQYGDQIAAVVVGVMIITAGSKVLGDCFREVSEESVDQKTMNRIKEIINNNDKVTHWHNLRTRTVGREIFIDLHILVNPELKITEAHDIAEKLENQLHAEIFRPVNITVHIEPDIEKLRK